VAYSGPLGQPAIKALGLFSSLLQMMILFMTVSFPSFLSFSSKTGWSVGTLSWATERIEGTSEQKQIRLSQLAIAELSLNSSC
jgi:hypothetical protein